MFYFFNFFFMKNFDMHCHTTISDGTSNPFDLIQEAQKRNLEFLCITDHDYPSDSLVNEIRGVWIVTTPSVEISASNRFDDDKSLHLTYYSKQTSERICWLLAHTRSEKEKLIALQIQKLQWLGFYIDKKAFYEELLSTWRQKAGLSKYDIARYITAQNQNREYLKNLGCYSWRKPHQEFYNRCLKRKGDLYQEYAVEIDDYEPEVEILGQEAKKERAILSIAHPNFSFSREGIHWFLEKFPHYKELWVNAVEINTRATKKWVDAILWLKAQYGDDLQLTFGSDCHRIGKPDDKHGDLWFENNFVPSEVVEREMERFQESLSKY
jgi:histidinol phosphatase-like PHP family hydrolase